MDYTNAAAACVICLALGVGIGYLIALLEGKK